MKLSNVLLKDHYRLLVLGGGTGGCTVAAKFQRILAPDNVAVVEPTETHYYQPGFTMVGSGLFKMSDIVRKEADVLPKKVKWLKDSVSEFHPVESRVQLKSGNQISYDFLVVALGLELRYDLIEGLSEELLSGGGHGVCSIYSPKYVEHVLPEVEKFQSGNAIFTLPKTPIKCAGAPQKIMYLTEEIFRKKGKRSNSRVIFNTALGKPFSVEKYSIGLAGLMKMRGIEPNFYHNLIKVDSSKKKAIFELLNADATPTGERMEYEYAFLHVAPPCSPVKALRETKADGLTDASGWVKVDAETLQSPKYLNVFAIGDCANLPTSKTMAAISSEFRTLSANLQSAMANKKLTEKYDGYTSCPLVVDSKHVVLAEFNGNTHKPFETFPYNQSKPSRFAFWLKRYIFPVIYWKLMMNGLWEGPSRMRKLFLK